MNYGGIICYVCFWSNKLRKLIMFEDDYLIGFELLIKCSSNFEIFGIKVF